MGGLHRLAVSDAGHPGLGYEGTHFYKINGKYYLFYIAFSMVPQLILMYTNKSFLCHLRRNKHKIYSYKTVEKPPTYPCHKYFVFLPTVASVCCLKGTHFYKINGKYYLFLIHSLRDRWMRTEACFVADSIDGVFTVFPYAIYTLSSSNKREQSW